MRIDYSVSNFLNSPKIVSDPRIKLLPIVNPSNLSNDQTFKKLKDKSYSSTIKGNFCTTCKTGGRGHSVGNQKLFLVGDSYLPALVGGTGDCIPTMRVENGNFQDLQVLLQGLKSLGFNPPAGSIFVVSLTHHLCMVGAATYWEQMDDFIRWSTKEFGVTVMPLVSPFPEDSSESYLLNIHQGLGVFRVRFIGDQTNGQDWRYVLWKPLVELLKTKECFHKKFKVPTTHLKHLGNVVLHHPNRVWMGFGGDFSEYLPPDIESDFIIQLCNELEKSAPPSRSIKVPSPEALEYGFNAASTLDGEVFFKDSPTIHLFGSSILREASEKISEVAKDLQINVVNNCQGTNIDGMIKDQNIPRQKHEKDVIVLSYLGNEFIAKHTMKKIDNVFHYISPKYHDDNASTKLVKHIQYICEKLRRVYQGTIVILGPLPRLIDNKCCDNETHLFPKHPIFSDMTMYTDMYNDFLSRHKAVNAKDVVFIPYKKIFHGGLGQSDLWDRVHLNYRNSDRLAVFVAHLTTYVHKPVTPLTNVMPSWLTWAEAALPNYASCAPTPPLL